MEQEGRRRARFSAVSRMLEHGFEEKRVMKVLEITKEELDKIKEEVQKGEQD